jgi:hypothetical protein
VVKVPRVVEMPRTLSSRPEFETVALPDARADYHVEHCAQ